MKTRYGGLWRRALRLIIYITVLCLCGVPVLAAPSVTLDYAVEDDNLILRVLFSENPGITSCRFDFTYPVGKVEPVSAASHTGNGDIIQYNPALAADTVRVLWMSATSADVYDNGELFNLSFKLIDRSTDFNLNAADFSIVNQFPQNISFTSPAALTVRYEDIAATPTPTPPAATPTLTPSATPTAMPTLTPSAVPTATPTRTPSATPTAMPTLTPSAEPTVTPTLTPSATPTAMPTLTPSAAPTATPTLTPSAEPTATPILTPSAAPTATPILSPSSGPVATPTLTPSSVSAATPMPPSGPVATPTLTPPSDLASTPAPMPPFDSVATPHSTSVATRGLGEEPQTAEEPPANRSEADTHTRVTPPPESASLTEPEISPPPEASPEIKTYYINGTGNTTGQRLTQYRIIVRYPGTLRLLSVDDPFGYFSPDDYPSLDGTLQWLFPDVPVGFGQNAVIALRFEVLSGVPPEGLDGIVSFKYPAADTGVNPALSGAAAAPDMPGSESPSTPERPFSEQDPAGFVPGTEPAPEAETTNGGAAENINVPPYSILLIIIGVCIWLYKKIKKTKQKQAPLN